MFVAVGHQGLRISSADGVAWQHEQVGKEGETYRAAAFGNGACTVVGGYGYGDQLMAVTKDAVAWNVTAKPKKTNYRSVFFGNGKFIALSGDPAQVGDAKPVVATSADGAAWSDPKPISGRFMLRRVSFGQGIFVGVGDRDRRSVSTDGLEWKDLPSPKPADTLTDIAFGNGVFVGVGMHGLRATTRDGQTWSEPQRGQEGEHLNAIVFADGRFVAVGAGATFISTDGEKWDRIPNRSAPLTCTFGQGVFLGAHWKGRIMRSADAITWEEAHKCPHHIEAIAFGDFTAAV